MDRFIQVVVDGIATGSIYAALALALVLIFRSTGVVNFAQGEMAMFSTFIAWGLHEGGLSIGAAIACTLAISFIAGMVIERVVIRPFEGGQELTLVIVTLGLFILLNSLAGWIWGFGNRGFPSVFGDGATEVAGVRLSVESLGIVAVLLAVVGLLFLLFQRTKIGLAHARGRAQPGVEPAGGHPRRSDADARLGARGDARRPGRRARRAAAVPGREPDGRRAHLRLRGRGPRRLRQPLRRGRSAAG